MGVFVDFEDEQSIVAAAPRLASIINVSGFRERISSIGKGYRGKSEQQQAFKILFYKVQLRFSVCKGAGSVHILIMRISLVCFTLSISLFHCSA